MNVYLEQELKSFCQASLPLPDWLEPLELEDHYLSVFIGDIKQYILMKALPAETSFLMHNSVRSHSLLIRGPRGIGKSSLLKILCGESLYIDNSKVIPYELLLFKEITHSTTLSFAQYIFKDNARASKLFLHNEQEVAKQKKFRARVGAANELLLHNNDNVLKYETTEEAETLKPSEYKSLGIDDVELFTPQDYESLIQNENIAQIRPIVLSVSDLSLRSINSQEIIVNFNCLFGSAEEPKPRYLEPLSRRRFYHYKREFNEYDLNNYFPNFKEHLPFVRHEEVDWSQLNLLAERDISEIDVNFFNIDIIDELYAEQYEYLCNIRQFFHNKNEPVQSNVPGIIDLRASLLQIHFWQEQPHLTPEIFNLTLLQGETLEDEYRQQLQSVHLNQNINMHEFAEFSALSGSISLLDFWFAGMLAQSGGRQSELAKYRPVAIGRE